MNDLFSANLLSLSFTFFVVLVMFDQIEFAIHCTTQNLLAVVAFTFFAEQNKSSAYCVNRYNNKSSAYCVNRYKPARALLIRGPCLKKKKVVFFYDMPLN